MKRGRKPVYTFLAPLERGGHKLSWPLPKRGSYQIILSAKSLNGITSSTTIDVGVPR